MNVPKTCKIFVFKKLFIDELKRLGRFLQQQGGKSPSDESLSEIMLEYDTVRTSILGAGGYLPSRQYAETIEAFNRDGPSQILNGISQSKLSIERMPLAILGGPLLKRDFEIFDIIEQTGGRIVLDATETGERGLCAPFDRRGLRDNPLLELASAYFCGIHDASRRPNSGLYQWLKSRLSDRDIRGIIFHRHLWCDMWHAELQRFKEWIDLPILDIDTAGNNEIPNQRTTNRIRAFLETLR
jgi:benzoyl-CoA reductase/2-hydroxyglutaryl-CoA dehydratase subunit BcrC/BadD/HgdB